MSTTYLPLLLAGIAVVLGLISVVLFYKVVIAPRKAEPSSQQAPAPLPTSSAKQADTPSYQSQPKTTSKQSQPKTTSKQSKKPTQQCLFVMFDAPSQAINQALGEMLTEKNAFYEAELGAFHLPPGLQGYPIMLASATSPGKLPPLHKEHKEGEHTPVQGVSILIRFLNTRKVSRNPEDLITFTHEVAALGGKILDAQRKPITEESLAAMYREGE
ncbi:cell division protein ZipA C-terminal FtsZ-binding domain-containing protein [Vreelandella aquamarina]|jgi:FtsZ-interacting cell division protein ZipA|uniref:cell division protein ZipA C-terminal FtsZ-binding domain-containing protein n=1 Tax=Halomonas sp. Cn5-12 TaxID=2908885 RepID=UPI001F3756E5|nr:cell division protein ZipA C-terminal FtsZ-binding domain-containing protein [Halomonas sp. Cn5-12]MCF2912804.1 hypothetical protein [Halomonas sp. Cn5-12]